MRPWSRKSGSCNSRRQQRLQISDSRLAILEVNQKSTRNSVFGIRYFKPQGLQPQVCRIVRGLRPFLHENNAIMYRLRRIAGSIFIFSSDFGLLASSPFVLRLSFNGHSLRVISASPVIRCHLHLRCVICHFVASFAPRHLCFARHSIVFRDTTTK